MKMDFPPPLEKEAGGIFKTGGNMDPKQAAARKALELVQDGMTLGIGTGSTSVHFITALGQKIRESGWHVRGVPTSERSGLLAQQAGISVIDLVEAGELDLAIDGADEADSALNLIKGGGGALLREKLVAAAAREFVVICDSSKLKPALGAFALPVAVVPFGWTGTAARLGKYGVETHLRQTESPAPGPYVTDDGLYLLDMRFGRIEDPASLEREIKQITGVVDIGLFIGMAHRLILGYEDGHTEEIVPLGSVVV
jgi:ribose 5-phosphate isomerase A